MAISFQESFTFHCFIPDDFAECRRARAAFNQERAAEIKAKVAYMTLCFPHLRAAVVVASTACVIHGAAAEERTIKIDIERARIVKLPEGAQTLIIGNPLIADVTMLKANQLMVITGKSFGSTNLIVLDKDGAQVGESVVTVTPAENKVVVQRGLHRESLSCQPHCAPAVDLADDMQYMSNVIGAAKAYEAATSGRK
jgi:hypothetical protein